ncbi:hypothetical protein [Rhizobium johnstonii]|uniref:hypothetical protein n=1 Tax=Rhizobium johnstonii TaxID=3019933 RepID=UPI003F9CC3A8
MPKTAVEATELAESLVSECLPHSMLCWLQNMEYHQLVAASVGGGNPPPPPEKTPELVEAVSQSVKSLTELLKPAHTRGPELEAQILKMFAAFNLYTGDQGKLNAMLEVWADELEEYPMYAIRKAYKWAIRGGDKLPSLAASIADVKLAIGSNVLDRKKALTQWLTM